MVKPALLKSPRARFYARTIVVAVIGYGASAIAQGGSGLHDLSSFALGAASAGAYAVVGLLTPTEPFVGLKQAGPVEVPADSTTQT